MAGQRAREPAATLQPLQETLDPGGDKVTAPTGLLAERSFKDLGCPERLPLLRFLFFNFKKKNFFLSWLSMALLFLSLVPRSQGVEKMIFESLSFK